MPPEQLIPISSRVRILADLDQGKLATAINTEIVQEMLYRYSNIGLAEKGILLCREMADLAEDRLG